jgi:2,5-diamino-6-(ribosylamino)-4(3H)-pyrimidinone 5'-phosphate reductase
MKPNIILHNSISIDGSLTNFSVDMEKHYQIASQYKPDAHLIGSNTVKSGLKLYGNNTTEEKKDFIKPKRNQNLPYWIIIDSKAKLKNDLHEIRRFELNKDIIIFLSEETNKDYIEYLKIRNYDYYVVGEKKVDLKKSFSILKNNYKIKKILTDTGTILGNVLLESDYIDEISLLIHPVIVGKKGYKIFSGLNKKLALELIKKQKFNNGFIWVTYKIKK